jgi:hypothetical protein
MSINKLVSIRVPIVDAMEFLNIDHDKLIPKFTRFATIAETQIGSAAQYQLKRVVLDINQCVACLPNDCVRVEIAVLGDRGVDCDDLLRNVCGIFSPATSYGTAENTFFVVDVGDNNPNLGFNKVNFSIQNNKLVFERSYDAQRITVQYLAYETDCDGFLMVGQNHVDAIREYIIWQYYRNKGSMNSLEYGKMNMAREEWNRECSHARAMDAIPTPSQRDQIVAMTHNPYAGISLRSGMFTTLGGMYSIW